jgi:hypothetical protein
MAMKPGHTSYQFDSLTDSHRLPVVRVSGTRTKSASLLPPLGCLSLQGLAAVHGGSGGGLAPGGLIKAEEARFI